MAMGGGFLSTQSLKKRMFGTLQEPTFFVPSARSVVKSLCLSAARLASLGVVLGVKKDLMILEGSFSRTS